MAEVLQQFSDAMADVVEHAGQGVVRVEARRRLPATGVIFSSDGYIVTSHHVVRRDEDIMIGLPNGERVSATLVGRDPSTDLALLKVDADNLSVPAWVEHENLRVGHIVLALGRPDQKVLATFGIVSALDGSWRTPGGSQIDAYLQTDVVMYPGFSGGPLVDASGSVVGINTSGLARGVSLAIPTATVKRVAGILMEHGGIKRGFLGIGTQAVQLQAEQAKAADQDTGLLVMSVESDSPAAQGGILVGDVVIALDGEPVRHIEELLALLSGERVGKEVSIKLMRGGQISAVNVTIGVREEEVREEGGQRGRRGWGRRGRWHGHHDE